MQLHPLPYKAALPPVRNHLCLDEDPKPAPLIGELREARRRGYLRLSELEAMCQWKSPRAIQHIRTNSASSVRAATCAALATRSEKHRLEALLRLNCVSVPMASAILMLLNPKRYGVIDIRVWELLYELGTVTKNAKGIAFGFNNWYQYLMIIRYLARTCDCTARDVERTLFAAHKNFQRGQLYARR